MKEKSNGYIIAAVTIVSITMILVAYKYSSNENEVYYKNDSSSSTQLVILPNSLTEKDTDGDGLKDWEEVIWHTDPNNPDTDGDGVSDGQEVKNGRNPNVKGPDDYLASHPLYSPNTSTTSLTKTDLFSRELYVQYQNSLNSDGTISPENQTKLVDSLIEKMEKVREPATQYDLTSIKTTADTSESTYKTYSEQFFGIFNNTKINKDNFEISILTDVISGKTKDLSALKNSVKYYDSMINKLLSVKVPNDLSDNHLRIINGLSRIKKNIQDLAELNTDSIVAVVAMKDYILMYQDANTTIQNIKTVLSIHGINI